MGTITVIFSFVVCIFFNIILNSFDVYSDIALTYRTLTFNLGHSTLLSGCRVCHGKQEEDLYTYKNTTCKQCLTHNLRLACGQSFEFLDKIHELENSESCEKQQFRVSWNTTSISNEFRNGTCDYVFDPYGDYCCFDNLPNPHHKTSLDHIDKDILVYQDLEVFDVRQYMDYDVYGLSTNLSFMHCKYLGATYFEHSPSNVLKFLDSRVSKIKTKYENEWFFRFVNSKVGKMRIEPGFDKNDECGLLVKDKLEPHVYNNGLGCELDSCLIHLQSLKLDLNISDIEHWKQGTFYIGGIKFGGKTCQLLSQYCLASFQY